MPASNLDQPSTGAWPLRGILIACLGAFVFFLLVPAFGPTPRLPWYEGVLLETAARLQHGGSAYAGLTDAWLVPAESPYFPGSIFMTWIVSSLVPLGTAWPRILGTLGTLFLFVAAWITAARLSRARVASGVLTTLAFVFPLAAVERFQAQSFFPDYLMGAIALLAASLVARDSHPQRSIPHFVAVSALLFLIGILKQSGFAIFVGFGVFAVWPGTGFPKTARLRLLAALTLAGLGVLAAVWFTPHCWEATVAAMSGHPIARTPAVRNVDLLGAALLSLSMIALAFFLPSKLKGTEKAVAQLIVCLFVPVLVIQSLSAYKAGGGGYDFLLPLFLGSPILVTGFLWFFEKSRMTLLVFVLGLGATVIGLRTGVKDLHKLPAEWARFDAEVNYLERFRGQRAFFNVYSYQAIRKAGLQPVTDIHTLTHYALGGLRSTAVLEAIRRREYDVVVGVERATLDQTSGNPFFRSAVMGEYGQAILQNYQAVEDAALPASLRGQVYVPIDARSAVPSSTKTN